MKVSRIMAVVVTVLLVFGACGGDDDDTSTTDTAGQDSSTQDGSTGDGGDEQTTDASDTTDAGSDEQATDSGGGDDEAGDSSSDGGTGPGGLAPGTGRVTIGDMTWEIVADIQCLDFGIALGFQGHAVDDPTVTVLLDANTDDPSANSAAVDVSDDVDWRAGDAYLAMGATIPEVTADNGYGTGTATFVDVLGPTESAEGSYEFFCG